MLTQAQIETGTALIEAGVALGEPFASKAQQRFAFGTHQPWAKKWADITDFKHLPARVKKKKNESNSSSDMGQLLRGKGGKWGNDAHIYERDFDKNVGGGVDRDKLSGDDFAGAHRSFPIVTQGDVSDALQSLGRTNQDRGKVRARIIAIAKRKGFKVPGESKQESEPTIPTEFGRSRFVESF